MLNNPTFSNSAVGYDNGLLKSTDNTVKTTDFTVRTGLTGKGLSTLSGTMTLNYPDTSGINDTEISKKPVHFTAQWA
ncbi:MAG: hypothetical protein LBR75_02995 [Prevotellaceae bacterium]|nr:hypothetical protein [Prevotellaceae bacterium]